MNNYNTVLKSEYLSQNTTMSTFKKVHKLKILSTTQIPL